MVSEVFPDATFTDEAMAYSQSLAQRAPNALRYMKENINRSGVVTIEAALDAEAVAMSRTMSTADHREAAAAFVEKRTPNFDGR
jgi:2-(1,2-epoxy-1,2-dihydrophenyl)acetyl-CoA isomerase